MCVFFDKLSAWRNIVTHEHGECTLCLSSIVDGDSAQSSLRRIHCGIPQLVLTHLSETFVTLHSHTLVTALSESRRSLLALIVSPAVNFFLAFLHKVKRRCRQINVSVPDEVQHISEEEGQDQCCNVASVHIGIGHD